MRDIQRNLCLFLFAIVSIVLGFEQAVAVTEREFTLHKGQSIFISADHLQNKAMLISENDEVASILNGIITANSVGETFCKEIQSREADEKRFKIKVLPPKLIRAFFTEPNNPRPGEELRLVAIVDASVERVKFLVSTDCGFFEAVAKEKYLDGDCFIHKTQINPRGTGNFTVKIQVQRGSFWEDVSDFVFSGRFVEESGARPTQRRVSDRGIEYIKAKEGYRSGIMEDGLVKNVYDIGYGSGVRAGDAFYNNVTRTAAHAMLVNRLNNGGCSRVLNNFILRNNLVLSQNEFDAVSSFTYNLGARWLNNSDLRNVFLIVKNTNSLTSELNVPQKKIVGTVVSTNGLRMREGCSTRSKILKILRFGEQVDVLSESRDGWQRVRASNGQEGYCFAEFLRTSSEYTNSNIGIVNSYNGLRLREGPSKDSRGLCVMMFNEQVEVLSDDNNDWYKVRTNSGQEGYCFAQFLTVRPPDVKNSANTEDFIKNFLSYNRAGGRFVKGLLNRRIEELQIYFYDDYSRDGGKNKYNFLLPDCV